MQSASNQPLRSTTTGRGSIARIFACAGPVAALLTSGCFDPGDPERSDPLPLAAIFVPDGSCPTPPHLDDAGTRADAGPQLDSGAAPEDAGGATSSDSHFSYSIPDKAFGCEITEALVGVFSAKTYCERVEQCGVPFITVDTTAPVVADPAEQCAELWWTERELWNVVWGLDFEQQGDCLQATVALDECALNLNCEDFGCYHGSSDCDEEFCVDEGTAYVVACGLLVDVLKFNRDVSGY